MRDLARSIRFYTEGLGLQLGPNGRMAAGGLWQELRDPESGAVLELNLYPGEPPYREGDERLAFLSDPDGVWVELYERVGDELPPTSRPGG